MEGVNKYFIPSFLRVVAGDDPCLEGNHQVRLSWLSWSWPGGIILVHPKMGRKNKIFSLKLIAGDCRPTREKLQSSPLSWHWSPDMRQVCGITTTVKYDWMHAKFASAMYYSGCFPKAGIASPLLPAPSYPQNALVTITIITIGNILAITSMALMWWFLSFCLQVATIVAQTSQSGWKVSPKLWIKISLALVLFRTSHSHSSIWAISQPIFVQIFNLVLPSVPQEGLNFSWMKGIAFT